MWIAAINDGTALAFEKLPYRPLLTRIMAARFSFVSLKPPHKFIKQEALLVVHAIISRASQPQNHLIV
jgi:hypothetical protein